ncbi:MAG TPA: ABC transporter permease subunit [Caulobacterales bacterium]|nr:ABC transporter permease subunit [Caulobacterales bacterium]
MTVAAPAEAEEIVVVAPVKGRSLWDDARRRLRRNPAAMASLVVLGVLALLALFGPLLWVHKVDTLYRDRVAIAPTWENAHWFGTDAQGRDMVARVLFGLGISLMVGVVATFVSLAVGVLYGATAGYVGGWVDNLMMRIVDVIYTVPFIFFVIILMVTFGSNILLIFVAIGAVEWLTMARIVRGQAIALKHKEFIEAARASGASTRQVITRHIAPNVLGAVVVYATLNVPVIILAESFLSFLGLGVQEPLTSLGQLIAAGAKEMDRAPWLLIYPGATMFITLLCLNFLGDGLRDALDPKER